MKRAPPAQGINVLQKPAAPLVTADIVQASHVNKEQSTNAKGQNGTDVLMDGAKAPAVDQPADKTGAGNGAPMEPKAPPRPSRPSSTPMQTPVRNEIQPKRPDPSSYHPSGRSSSVPYEQPAAQVQSNMVAANSFGGLVLPDPSLHQPISVPPRRPRSAVSFDLQTRPPESAYKANGTQSNGGHTGGGGNGTSAPGLQTYMR